MYIFSLRKEILALTIVAETNFLVTTRCRSIYALNLRSNNNNNNNNNIIIPPSQKKTMIINIKNNNNNK